MTAPKLPRRRAAHSKVSTGCYSCKKRRIKCDETRPTCDKCTKAGFECAFPVQVQVQTQMQTQTQMQQQAQVQPLVTQPSPLHAGVRLSPTETLYWDFFRSSVVCDLATHSASPHDLSRTILREFARDHVVRLSIIGVGALALANRGPCPDTHTYKALVANHRTWRDAVSYHSRAIALFRARLASKQSPAAPRSILIVTVLFILFELAQGNTGAVDSLASVALSTISHPLRLQADTTTASTLPAKVDDNGITSLTNLFFLVVAYGGHAFPAYAAQRDLVSSLEISTLNSAVPGGVPEDNCLSIRAALTHWEAFVARATLWGVRTYALVGKKQDAARADPHLRDGQRRFVSQLLEWEVIIKTSMARETSEEAHLAWLELLFGVNVLYVFAASALGSDECRYDAHLERFRTAMDAIEKRVLAIMMGKHPPSSDCHSVSDDNQQSAPAAPTPSHSPEAQLETENSIPVPSFAMPVLNSRLLQSLAIIMRICRDRVLRYRVMTLAELVTTPISTWDDKAMFIGSKVMVQLEERGRIGLSVSSSTIATESLNTKGAAKAQLDDTVRGLPLEQRIQWRDSEWTHGHAVLKLKFFFPETGESVKVNVERGGEYDYLLRH